MTTSDPLASAAKPDRCPTCGNMGIDEWHPARCAFAAVLKARVEQHGAKYDIPAVAAFDLFAHLRQIGDDGELALRRAMTVMDLGWRPVKASVIPAAGDATVRALW